MVIYYTGTGNSRFTAQAISHMLGDELTDAGTYIKAGRKAHLSSQRPWVFVSPTYSWRIPRIFEAFIRNGRFIGSRQAYFVMTCGDDVGAAAKRLRAMCEEIGFVFMGLQPVIMPENYLAMFAVPEKDEAAAIIEEAKPVIKNAAELISAGQPFPAVRPGFFGKAKSGLVNSGFYSLCVNARAFRVTDACVGCGLCERLCPTNSITIENGRPVWGAGCTHCMACICRCPKEAIEYGKKSVGKPRYRCPEYEPE